MSQESRHVFTVRRLTQYVKALLAQDRTLRGVWVRGEISDLTKHVSGHIYFTLKDAHSQLRCVFFREEAKRLRFDPSNGTEVVARGAVTVYEPRGQYQLVVRELEQAGVGDLHQAFERLRRKLAEEGLFEESRKRPLPAFPRKLALLTSPIGAAVHDVVSTLRKRWPMVDVVLIPTPVSGAAAAPGLAKALGLLRAVEGVEVAILARGGGAMEELAGFNAEEVARAVAASPVPIVTGIGHESDFTIADFVADHRAPTPTGAATAAVPDRRELLRTVLARRRAAAQRLERLVERCQRELNLLRARPVLRTPRLLFASQRQRVDEVMVAVRQQVTRRLDGIRDRVTRATERLEALNPTSVLARGYSITRLPDGTVVRSVRQLARGAAAEVILSEGSAEMEVRKLREPSDQV